MNTDGDKNLFGVTNFRGSHVTFGIKTDDRRRHMYVIGKTGSGKSKLLETMAIHDILSGQGVAVVDPHGEFAEAMLDFIPESRIEDVIYFNPADINNPIAFNPLEQVSSEHRHLIASGIMGVFKKIWVDAWSARMEYILNNTLLALLEYPDATILGVMRMFAEPEYRKRIVSGLTDPVIRAFWVNEYARYSQKFETEAVAAIQNKIGQFVSNPLIRNIIGQTHSAINMRKIMDNRKIFIANLSKGKIGEDNSRLLGAMLITRIQLAAMSRVDVLEENRPDFFAYVDEFQNFATESFASILSEARKYHLCLILAHQYIEQLDEGVRAAVFGNVGTIVCFRVGAPDAEFLEREFLPYFAATDLVNLEKRGVYLKLLIDGVASQPFSAMTSDRPALPAENFKDVIVENSRVTYAAPRDVIERQIASEWLEKSETTVRDKELRRGEQSLDKMLGHGNSSPNVVKKYTNFNRESPRRNENNSNYDRNNNDRNDRPNINYDNRSHDDYRGRRDNFDDSRRANSQNVRGNYNDRNINQGNNNYRNQNIDKHLTPRERATLTSASFVHNMDDLRNALNKRIGSEEQIDFDGNEEEQV